MPDLQAYPMALPSVSAPSVTSGKPDRRLLLKLALILISVPGAVLNFGMAYNFAIGGGVDFNQFYSAGQLVGSGHLYDFDAISKLEAPHGVVMPTGRLPVVIYGWKLLNLFRYNVARFIWLGACFLALLVFGALWPDIDRRILVVALAWSMPAGYALVLGQDSPFWLMFFALGLAFLTKDRPWLAGVCFALCICKFHLALGVPVFLAARKLWRALTAGAVAAAVLLGACFWIEGSGWAGRYLETSKLPQFSPAAFRMPNLHGLASRLPDSDLMEGLCAFALIGFLWTLCRRSPNIGLTGSATAACGLLLGRHAYANDLILLLPLTIVLIQNRRAPPWLRLWGAITLTPCVIFLLGSHYAFAGQALAVGFALAALTFQMRAARIAPAC